MKQKKDEWDVIVDAGAGFRLYHDEIRADDKIFKNVMVIFEDTLILCLSEDAWPGFRKLVEVTEIADATFRAGGKYDLPVGYKLAVRFSTEDQWTEFHDAVLEFDVPDI